MQFVLIYLQSSLFLLVCLLSWLVHPPVFLTLLILSFFLGLLLYLNQPYETCVFWVLCKFNELCMKARILFRIPVLCVCNWVLF